VICTDNAAVTENKLALPLAAFHAESAGFSGGMKQLDDIYYGEMLKITNKGHSQQTSQLIQALHTIALTGSYIQEAFHDEQDKKSPGFIRGFFQPLSNNAQTLVTFAA
jgi:hypothetical protein